MEATLRKGPCSVCGGRIAVACVETYCSSRCKDELNRRAALEARLAAAEVAQREAESWRDKLLAWQDAVTAEVLMHPDLPCGRDEVSVEDVPSLLAIMARRIDSPDDYEGPPHVPNEDDAALAPAAPASNATTAEPAKEPV